MTVLPPSDAAGAAEARLRDIERRLSAIETMRRMPYTEVYDDEGNLAMRFDANGFAVFDDSGNAQLEAGDLGAGEYGVEVAGGRLRAIDVAGDEDQSTNVSLNTSAATKASLTLTPPSWATQVTGFVSVVFEMQNPTGGVVGQYAEIEMTNGVVSGTGARVGGDVAAGGLGSISTSSGFLFPDPLPITVNARAWVSTGTNSSNVVRVNALAFYLR